MTIRAGQLRHYLEIQAPQEVVSDHHETKPVWTTVAEVWGNVQPEGGSEGLEGQQTVGRRRHTVALRDYPGLSSSHRLIHEGRPLNIESVIEVGERHTEMRCVCVEDELATLQLPQLQSGALTLHALVGRPATTSARLRVVTPIEVEAYFEWGTTDDYLDGSTTVAVYQALEKIETDVTGLTADMQYYYRLRYRRRGAATWTDSEHTFRTARAAGQPFSFGVMADAHMHPRLVSANHAAKSVYDKALANMDAANLDGIIDLGDLAHTEHYGGWDSPTYRDALRRYLYTTGLWGSALSSGWTVLTLGNHEAEQGWRHGAGESLPGWSRDARKLVMPNPSAGALTSDLGGNLGTDGENCSSFVWGDALFIFLDPYAWTTTKPHNNGGVAGSGNNWDWTLGEDQHTWLKAELTANTSKWIFVCIHQIVGGITTYGRGGIEAAKYSVNAKGSYEWGGEDAIGANRYGDFRAGWVTTIHDALAGAARAPGTLGVVVFMGHDHVGVIQELGGVNYHHVGKPSDEDYGIGMYVGGGYANGEQKKNSHHLQVYVTSTSCTIKTVAAVRAGDTAGHGYVNNEIMDEYVLS